MVVEIDSVYKGNSIFRKMRETFIKVYYVVAWAGCNIPLKDRTFAFYDEAEEYYTQNIDKLAIRVEEVATKVQIKIVLPESIRKRN